MKRLELNYGFQNLFSQTHLKQNVISTVTLFEIVAVKYLHLCQDNYLRNSILSATMIIIVS